MIKLYAPVFSLLLLGQLSVRGQDSSRCNAAFQVVDVYGNQVFFRANDSLPGITHHWNFGDSTQFTSMSPAADHLYRSPGSYAVTQVVVDSVDHCRDSVSQVVTISGPPPLQCSVSFTVSNDSINHIYTFVAQPVVAAGVVDTVIWKIDDTLAGRKDTLEKHLGAGSYNICVYISTSLGCQAQSCQTINVSDSVRRAVENLITSFPDPATTTANLTVTLSSATVLYIHVYNSMGGQVLVTTQSGNQGVNQVDLPIANLPTGIYYIQVQYGNTVLRSKVQKL